MVKVNALTTREELGETAKATDALQEVLELAGQVTLDDALLSEHRDPVTGSV